MEENKESRRKSGKNGTNTNTVRKCQYEYFQRPEKINAKNCKQESKKQRHPEGDTTDGVIKCERNDRKLSNIPEDKIHLAERPFQINNSDKVTSAFLQGKSKGEKHQKELRMHKRDHKNEKIFTCPECNKSFTRLIGLKIHQRNHTGDKPYKCTVCNKSFTQLSTLKVHQRIHTGDKPYKCTLCNKSFTQLSNLKAHQRIHTGDKSFTCTEPYKCTVCNKSFTQLSNLKAHQRIHTGDKPYKCTVCNKSFTRLSNLKAHQRIHTGDKPFTCTEPYKCTVCNKSFTQLSNLKAHQRIHTGDKPFTCTECNKSFTQHSYLKRHQRIHTEDKPFTCTECKKSFNWHICLKLHQRIHTGDKPFTCTECNKSFTQHSYLKGHQRIHTGDKPYTCSECNKTFIQLSGLKRHQRIHTGDKPFTCTECNKSFTQHSSLKGHQRIHTGDKPFTCTVCNKSFTMLSGLKRHQGIHTHHKPFTSNLPLLQSHPFLPAMRKAWRMLCRMLKISPCRTPCLPIVGNGDFLPGLDSAVFQRWSSVGLQYVSQAVMRTGFPVSFAELQTMFCLLPADWFAYRQLQHYLQTLTPAVVREDVQDRLQEALCLTAQVPIPLKFYHKLLQELSGELDFLTLAQKWSTDLQIPILDDMICKGIRLGIASTQSSMEREQNYKFWLRAFYPPKRAHVMGISTGHCCGKCAHPMASFGHMFWTCPLVSSSWIQLVSSVRRLWSCSWRLHPSFLFTLQIRFHPPRPGCAASLRKTVLLGQKCILLQWLSPQPPSIPQWRALMLQQMLLEHKDIVDMSAKADRLFCQCWQPFSLTFTPYVQSQI
uniref:Zinc finger protein 271-like isoform X1 n=1 Tax=Geotrypetes seraphini TaxID=260995 RepID=A0A6P8PHT1_GEOSA|nr:zinc finger protein 271-like isoform X1 [Geotrypetes seraphini]XP_033788247.1 zinc finger protein 271-like isoform X1 [Geotrypetes seraphini]